MISTHYDSQLLLSPNTNFSWIVLETKEIHFDLQHNYTWFHKPLLYFFHYGLFYIGLISVNRELTLCPRFCRLSKAWTALEGKRKNHTVIYMLYMYLYSTYSIVSKCGFFQISMNVQLQELSWNCRKNCY